MKTELRRTCPSCGNEFSEAMEFCPVCILRGAARGESAAAPAVNPTGEPEQGSEEGEPASPVNRFEHYELMLDEEGRPIELGRGSMGVTYKALDVDLRCPVTLKVINEKYLGDESARLRFLREARAAASVRHPNVASVFHLGRTRKSYFYAMEFVEGETLASLMNRTGRIEVKLALEIATQVAAGLAAVHKQRLVHRDIKASNIMVNMADGDAVTAKIVDLGLAKTVNEPDSEAAISIPGWFAGTPEFASPEQFAGVGVDIRSDLYSLGAMLWVAVTGHRLFRGSPAEVMYQHQHAPLPLKQLKDVPQPVVTLLEVLLEKDPARRFQSPTELLKAMPTITGAIDAGRTISRGSLRPAATRPGEFCDTLSGIATAKLESMAPAPKAPELDQSTPPRLQSSPEVLSQAAPMRKELHSRPLPTRRHNLFLFAAALGAIMLVTGLVWFLGPKFRNPTVPALRGTISPKPTAVFVFHSPPTPGKPWSNSLGMRFVPLGEIHLAVWQTRVRDFEVFVHATGYDAVGGMSSAITRNGFKLSTMSWMAPGFQQTPEQPVVGVSWEDANQFCAWLTKKERSEGALATFQSYRLPTDREWSRAVGLEHEQGATPADRSGKIKSIYPWGTVFPPPNDVANYAGEESREGAPDTWMVIAGFHDAFPRTAPVSAFKANAKGLYCLGGNVWEWCMDTFENGMDWRTLRGGSWATSSPEELLSSHRRGYGPLFRSDDIGFRCVIAIDGAHE